MGKIWSIGFGVLFATGWAASPASSQVTGVFTANHGQLDFLYKPASSILSFSADAENIAVEGGYAEIGSANVFAMTSLIESDHISFRNGSSSAGSYATTTSHTALDIHFTNDSASTVHPVLNSTILGAGMGLFVGDVSCLNGLNSCAPDANLFGGSATFQDFMPNGLYGNLTNLAGASFEFKITGGGNVIYDLTGSLALMRDPGTGTNFLLTDLGAAQAALTNFRLSSDPGSGTDFGALWDPTNILVDFGGGSDLAPGESSTLTYETTVSSYSLADCTGAGACLISYAAFGDPIGRGGGVTASTAFLKTLLSSVSFDTPGLIRIVSPPEDDPLAFHSTNFGLPTFHDGVLSFKPVSTVPEPASWAMMIGGLALVGRALRGRSRTLVLSDRRA